MQGQHTQGDAGELLCHKSLTTHRLRHTALWGRASAQPVVKHCSTSKAFRVQGHRPRVRVLHVCRDDECLPAGSAPNGRQVCPSTGHLQTGQLAAATPSCTIRGAKFPDTPCCFLPLSTCPASPPPPTTRTHTHTQSHTVPGCVELCRWACMRRQNKQRPASQTSRSQSKSTRP